MSAARLPTFYIPHGGGPCFFMDWTMGPADTWDSMARWLQSLASTFPKPSAIVVFSAHWETQVVSVTGGAAPDLIYDYYGFPEHTYAITYPAPGNPELAERICDLLNGAGIAASNDTARGFDHGVFIPLKLMFPGADIPVVAVSLQHDLDPSVHLEIGLALAGLRDEKVLLLGSGMSFHNLPLMMSGRTKIDAAEKFDEWLAEVCAKGRQPREAELRAWTSAPAAREAHPRAEHLLPLMCAAGAAGEQGATCVFSDHVMGSRVSAFRFD